MYQVVPNTTRTGEINRQVSSTFTVSSTRPVATTHPVQIATSPDICQQTSEAQAVKIVSLAPTAPLHRTSSENSGSGSAVSSNEEKVTVAGAAAVSPGTSRPIVHIHHDSTCQQLIERFLEERAVSSSRVRPGLNLTRFALPVGPQPKQAWTETESPTKASYTQVPTPKAESEASSSNSTRAGSSVGDDSAASASPESMGSPTVGHVARRISTATTSSKEATSLEGVTHELTMEPSPKAFLRTISPPKLQRPVACQDVPPRLSSAGRFPGNTRTGSAGPRLPVSRMRTCPQRTPTPNRSDCQLRHQACTVGVRRMSSAANAPRKFDPSAGTPCIRTSNSFTEDFSRPKQSEVEDTISRKGEDADTFFDEGVRDSIGLGLFRTAILNVVPTQRAKHPRRAAAGLLLLQHVFGAGGAKLEDVAITAEDLTTAKEFETVRTLFLDSIPEGAVEIGTVDQVLQPKLLKRFLQRVADERASIEVTFHGTRAEYVKQILNEGLNPNMCVTGAYGRGAYVATHAGVAHQYADPDESGWRHMCVILALVGNHVVKGREGEIHSSLAVDRLVNPTQYCFLDEERLYVSHLITYRATTRDFQRTGGGWEDPFHIKLNAALRVSDCPRRHKEAK